MVYSAPVSTGAFFVSLYCLFFSDVVQNRRRFLPSPFFVYFTTIFTTIKKSIKKVGKIKISPIFTQPNQF